MATGGTREERPAAERSASGRRPPAATDLDRRSAVAVALALPAALYLATLYPGIGDRAASGDAVEFQTVGRVLGVAHEPGYPQYVLLSFLWSWLPLPLNLASRINLLSAVFALAAGGVLFAAARALSGHAIAAVLACWALLTAPDLWRLATEAEVYTLHVLWVALFFYNGLRWQRDPSRRRLLLLLFAYALAFGNHLSMIALLPALVFLLLSTQPQLVRDLSAWGWAALAAATGAAQYLFLVWRSYRPHPTLLERFPRRAGAAEIVAYVTGDRFVEKHWLPAGGGEWLDRAGQALAHGAGQLTLPFALLALVGLLAGWRRRPARPAFLLVAVLSIVLFAAAYDIRDWLLYTIPAWLAGALLAADGLGRLLRHRARAAPLVALALGLVLAPRIVRGAAELRVADNPSDLTRVLPALPAGARILPAGGKRLARLYEEHYRHAARVSVPEGARFLAARQDVLHKALHLRRRRFYFRSPTVEKIFAGRLIDYRAWPGWSGPGAPVLVTGTDKRLTEIELRALPGGVLELAVRRQRRTLDDEKDLYLFFAAARDGRSKGLEGIDLAAAGGSARARQLLAELPTGDFAAVLVPRTRAETREAIAAILVAAGVPPPAADSRRFAAAWRHRAAPPAARLWQEPADGERWTVRLADPSGGGRRGDYPRSGRAARSAVSANRP